LFGELKKIHVGWVDFDPEDISLISFKISKVKSISATEKVYRIETIEHQEFYSVIRPSKRVGYIVVGSDSAGGADIPLTYIGKLSYFSPNKNLWEGDISAGYTYTRSSDIGRINLDATLRYLLKKGQVSSNISFITTQSEGAWTRDREGIGLVGNYYLKSAWNAAVFLSYQRNIELGLASRFQEGAGIGYNFISLSKMRGDMLSGIVVNQEKSIDSDTHKVTAEFPLLLSFDFFRFSKPELSLKTTQNLFVSLTQKGRIRHDGEIRLDWKVVGDFTTNLKLYNNYDNQPLSGSGATFDYGVVFGIGFKFD
jgi:hypothetical protein